MEENKSVVLRSTVVSEQYGQGVLVLEEGRVSFLKEGEEVWATGVKGLKGVKISRKAAKMRIVIGEGEGAVEMLGFESVKERDEWGGRLTMKSFKYVHESEVQDGVELTSKAATRATILSKNPNLAALHTSLVITRKALTDDEFWATRTSLLPSTSIPMRSAHYSRELIAESSQEHRTYKLNKQLISDIFKEHPLVEEAYVARVLREGMAEEAFWSDFLRSSYFQNREVRGNAAKANIFTGVLQREDLMKKGEAQPEATVVLEPDVLTNREGYGTRKPSEWTGAGANMALIDSLKVGHGEETCRKFNHHSKLVLSGTKNIAHTIGDETQEIATQKRKTLSVLAASTMQKNLKRVKLDPVTTELQFTRQGAAEASKWLVIETSKQPQNPNPPPTNQPLRSKEVQELLTKYWSAASERGASQNTELIKRLLKHIRAYYGELEDAVGVEGDEEDLRDLQKKLHKAMENEGGSVGGWSNID